MEDRRRVWREGLVAGLIGAASVALWFLIVDVVAGQPLATPDLLGRSLLSVLGQGATFSPAANVVAYTLFHGAAFAAVGWIVAWIVDASARTPGVLVGLLLFFVMFEAGFYGLTLFLPSATGHAQLAWYQIGVANLIASGLMGWYLWRAHPELGERVEGALSARL